MFPWIKRFLPSFRVGKDPLATGAAVRYGPMSIATMKLTPLIKRRVLCQRRSLAFQMQEGLRLTIIVAYRNRAAHLSGLVPVLRSTLAAQGIQARVLVVEQQGQGLFNRGKLMNVGAHHAQDASDYYCFHDVDLIPEVADYRCPSQPLRLVTQLSCTHRDFTNLSGPCLGGAVAMRKDQFQLINGFSNRYRGWGQEDDDFLMRCLFSGLVPHEDREGRFADLDTPAEELKVKVEVALRGSNLALKRAMWRGLVDFHQEGLSSLDYSLQASEDCGDYEKILVAID